MSTSSPESEVRDGFRHRRGWLHTTLSFAIALTAFAWVMTRLDFAAVWRGILASDWRWYALGFVAFWLSLPLRAWRWRLLLSASGDRVPFGRLNSAIFRAWVVNCALPGRSGDIYSAYLLRSEQGLSMVKTGGTIFTARILDLLTLVGLLAWVFLASFRQLLPAMFSNIVFSGLAIAALLLISLWLLRLLRPRLEARLPERYATYLGNFSEGVFSSIRNLPLLLLITLSLWVLEAARLGLVLSAIGIAVPPDRVAFLALTAAIVTTLPITPGGLGTVEALFGELFPRLGIPLSISGSAIFLDRFINYWFILLAGLVYFILTRVRDWSTRREPS